ncbi:universal stress protein [Lacisediminihabitans changchengi]|uniref:Universal stress protein n=1 Tax=Lacisediminihabitans changchengi TaxID=2787634 RepID=A0A934SM60_9MICO|nr:universal stress protein [Lacisediminihabitans changchengi]MBK4346973.1 universal stress protein [Lacisediminihabitans changchengi]MBK4347904.1 universal stress protein [Lacisediminihabitans changchengi]
MKPILVGIDGSLHSLEALRYAKRVAIAMGLPLRIVSVWHYRSGGFGLPPIGMVSISLDSEPQVAAQKTIDDFVFSALGTDPKVQFGTAALEGEPADVLIGQSAGAELLVVGSRGLGSVSSVLLGSVSSPCAQRAHCPVLVFHPPVRN